MKANPAAQLADVRAVYDGIQARLYELFMGQQIHVGGFRSSMELADLAGIGSGDRGVELCCGSGASMRALVAYRDVASMTGVELASAPVERGRQLVEASGIADRIQFLIGDATHTDLSGDEADFVWGEDAWCYVPDKELLVAEAVRLVRPGGVIVFTDWVEGAEGLTDGEASHVMQMMTFPSLQTIAGYRASLEGLGCEVVVAEDTARFGPSFKLYADLLRAQLSFDALELLGSSTELLDVVIEQLEGLSRLGYEGKLVQARFVARACGPE
jgi:ubiquinone/menaquinone biosynthesis C-methylase UbiE